MADLWASRTEALQVLSQSAPEVMRALEAALLLADDCALSVARLDSVQARISALCLVKARALAHGCLSLTLDSLSQEAGALLRPLFEYVNLIAYMRQDSTRADDILRKGTPKAGKVAKALGGELREIREYLNSHASHSSIGPAAMLHLVDRTASGVPLPLRVQQSFSLGVALQNLEILYSVLILLAIEGVSTAVELECDEAESLRERLQVLLEPSWRGALFSPGEA